MKFRMLMVLMTLSMVAPAVFGSAWAGMTRGSANFQPEVLECNKHQAKFVAKADKAKKEKEAETTDAQSVNP